MKYLRERERLGGSDEQKVYVLDGGFMKWQEKYVRVTFMRDE